MQKNRKNYPTCQFKETAYEHAIIVANKINDLILEEKKLYSNRLKKY